MSKEMRDNNFVENLLRTRGTDTTSYLRKMKFRRSASYSKKDVNMRLDMKVVG